MEWWHFLGPVATLAIAIVGGAIGYGILKERSVRNAEIAAAALARAEAADQRAASAGKDLAEFREKVARDYASNEMVRGMEDRIAAAINRLGDRLDRFLEVQGRIS